MKFPSSLFIFHLAATLFSTSNGQTTHMVTVGIEGSFYNPAEISAQVNDTITFVFGADFHDVTQSSFENPCLPLPGGFSSGFAGRGTNATAPAFTWDLHITDVSQALWFFCAATIPVSHCASGMVGVINPPSIQMYNQFVAAAKTVSGTPVFHPTPVLSGQGAFATSPPLAVNSSSTPAPTAAPPPASSTPESPTESVPVSSATTSAVVTPAASHSNKTAIIGGAVGGGGGLIILLISFLIIRRRRKAEPRDFFKYTVRHGPASLYPESHVPGPQMATMTSGPSNRSMGIARSPSTADNSVDSSTRGLAPLRAGDIGRQASFATTTTQNLIQSPRQPDPPPVDIGVLAREVAVMLMRNPAQSASLLGPGDEPSSEPEQNIRKPHRQPPSESGYLSDASTAPPIYRST
ncbi:hypothetical protein BD779DRAFT_666861 [Infundibulicybe gibba]|nr:hypothetical protein BD779DRAFT_666861 [Infundibulicybe gibba]